MPKKVCIAIMCVNGMVVCAYVCAYVCVCVCAYTHVWQLLIHMVTERARIREVKKVPMEFFNFVNMHAFFIPMYFDMQVYY